MKINKDKFLDLFTVKFGSIKPEYFAGLSQLVDCINADDQVTDPRWAAYMLATTKHETSHTFLPIEEFGKGKGKKYGVKDPVIHLVYYGRGFVQLTWAEVYRKTGAAIGVDLYHNPALALQSDIAYKIMSYGMRKGIFTGVGLSKYINAEKCDYYNARRIINGIDCAEKIAGYAKTFEGILIESTTEGLI